MTVEDKWRWKMDYCKKQGIPPAQTWAWEQAEKAFCMTYNPKLTGERMNEVNEASPAEGDVERRVRCRVARTDF